MDHIHPVALLTPSYITWYLCERMAELVKLE